MPCFLIAVDGVVLLGLFCSWVLATCWGELCGIRPHRDKSGLGGFMAVFLFMPLRWLCTFAGLAAALWLWPLEVLQGRALLVIGAHTALGVANVLLFQHGVSRVQRDLWAGDALCVVGGVLLPLPGLLLALLGPNRFLRDGIVVPVCVGAAVAAVLWFGFRQRVAEMRRVGSPAGAPPPQAA